MDPLEIPGEAGNGVSAFDGSIKFHVPLGYMAARTGRIRSLWAPRVVCTGDKVHVVVTRAARGSRWLEQIVCRLTTGAIVAVFARSKVLRKGCVREVINALAVSNDHIRSPGNHAGKIWPRVNLVHHHREVHRVSCI